MDHPGRLSRLPRGGLVLARVRGPPTNPFPDGRFLLRFWAVDYKAEVWLNGRKAGEHEGGETPFVLDVTALVKPGETNLLAVRVLNPTHTSIDGIVLNETPHRNKTIPYAAGNAWNQGGIIDSVELITAPAVRVEDLFVRPDWKTGQVRIQAAVRNATANRVSAKLALAVAPAAAGETVAARELDQDFPPGLTQVEAQLQVEQPHLWELNDPFLYRVSARVESGTPHGRDECSVRCGFRDFRFENGAFRLNGRRIFLRCSHTGNACPVGLEFPLDPDFLRRDLLNARMMGFNAIRFISGVARRYQLDLCDEIGLMVYEEAYASWCLADSPEMPRRYDESILGMVRRDRNHPSVVIWGLLNETPDGPVFRHAAGLLPALRALDDTRMVMLNSGRWDDQGGDLVGMESWREPESPDPCVNHNGTTRTIKGLGITWSPGELAFHPGRNGEYAVVRWTAAAAAEVEVDVVFQSIAERATTDVHVLHNGRALHDGWINLQGRGPRSEYRGAVRVNAGDTIDCALGFGNGDYGADTTALTFKVKTGGGTWQDAAADFALARNPNGPWSYGQLPPGPKPDSARMRLFRQAVAEKGLGTLSNPGSTEWEDTLADRHPYQGVPHSADIIRQLRTMDGGRNPLFISEYGIGSGVDLWRATRHYERLGATYAMDARFYRDKLDRFLADWTRWRMAEVFDRPEDFFAESNRRMAGQRLLGLNAIRANPHCVGHSLTGTVDQGMTGEGLWTTFREFKPGTMDAVFDGWAPLRWCLFVEAPSLYSGSKARFEAVLANEDQLKPGTYPVRLAVFGPDNQLVWTRQTNVVIRETGSSKGASTLAVSEPPFAQPVFGEDIPVTGPSGRYRFTATMDQGAAPAGGQVEFFLTDPARMPAVETDVVLWGDDPVLVKWLDEARIRHRAFAADVKGQREVILAGVRPPAPGGASAFRELARRLAGGSTAIFLSPQIFAQGDKPTRWVPLASKGALVSLNAWLYHKDEWARPHPVFAGLPTGMMDYTFYRNLVPAAAFTGQEAAAEVLAGANDTSIAYASGVMLSVHPLGAGRFVLNTLRLRENLGRDPAADRLLRNLLIYAASDSAKPLAEIPAGFEVQLKAMGFE